MTRNLTTQLIILLVCSTIFAVPSLIPVTRNLRPQSHPEGTYQEYLSQLEIEETSFQEIYTNSDNGRQVWLLIVEEELSQSIEAELMWWTEDLNKENTDAIILSWTGTSAADLKSTIESYYDSNGISGVFLLGNLPVFWFELWEDWDFDNVQDPNEEWVEFPMDEYFVDFDGTWADMDNDGVYDLHEGEVNAEIAIGRLRGDNLSLAGDEAEILQNWFERNHLYRNGLLDDTDSALGYIDDDWVDWQNEYHNALSLAYSDVEMVYQVNSTTATDYRQNRWEISYEWIQVHVHSGPDAHYFYQNNGSTYNLVYNNEIPQYQPQALFYNLFCCSNARFTNANSMGSLYVLGNENGLASIGSTKTGSMLYFENFYAPLGNSASLGEALKIWWNETVDADENYIQGYRAWFYGMVLSGDPTMKTEYECNVNFGDVDYNEAVEAYDASLILLYSLEMNPGSAAPLPWSPARLYAADVDGNEIIEAYDAALVLQYFVELINSFPVQER